jgi:PIN like domain
LQLDDFILYLDENLDNCKPIMDALTGSAVKFERHSRYFERGTLDDVWLPFVAERSWVVLTKDKKNRYNELEREVIRRHKVREFYFGRGDFNGSEMAQALMAAVPEMRKICRSYNPPLVGSITRTGIITVVYDEKGSTHERRKAAQAIP